MTGQLDILKLIIETAKQQCDEESPMGWKAWLFSNNFAQEAMKKDSKLGRFLHEMQSQGKIILTYIVVLVYHLVFIYVVALNIC